jgi:hypothetical protein
MLLVSFSQKVTMQRALHIHSQTQAGYTRLTLLLAEKNLHMRMKVPSTSLPNHTSLASLVSTKKKNTSDTF